MEKLGNGIRAISAGTTKAGPAQVVFSNSNGLSFGANGQTVTGSYTVPSTAGLLSNINVSAGTTSNNLSAITFSNANGITFGLDASTVTASHNALTSQSNQNVTAANGGFAFQTLSFSNANNFSFGTSAGSAITGSYTVPTVTNSSWTVSDNATSGTVARLAFTNQNGVTLSLSTGAGGSHTIVGSHNGLTSQSTQFLALTLGGNTAGTTTFHASNNASLFFHGGNNITLSGNGSSVTISGAGGGGTTNQTGPNIGVSNLGNTAGSTGTISTGTYVLVGTNDITLSQSTAAAGSDATVTIVDKVLSGFVPYGDRLHVVNALGNATLYLDPLDVQRRFQYDNFGIYFQYSQATNSTLTVSCSVWHGWYTKNGLSLSLYTSGSGSFSINGSGTASSGQNSGVRAAVMASTITVPAGNYVLGVVSRTTTAGNNASISNLCVSHFASTYSGLIGVATAATNQLFPGKGVYTASTSGMPASIHYTQINGNSSLYLRTPVVVFSSGWNT